MQKREAAHNQEAGGAHAAAGDPEDPILPLDEVVEEASGASEARAHAANTDQREPAKPRRPVLEVLLDPRSIQWLLTLGGALMVLGLIIWMASFPFFKQPAVLAILMGVGTMALLAGGWLLSLKSPYKVAGQALAFLACGLTPLNLWFYHAQNLVTLSGHLWVAGLICCLLYAATAYALRDPLFVYAFVGGVTLTLLLFMAELDVARQLPTLSLALAILGLIAIHVELAFPPEEGPFTRRRFGMPFFWSGQALLAAGLLLMLGAQIMAWLNFPTGRFLGYEWTSLSSEGFPILPIVAWVVGTYAYLYSDIVVRRVGVYTFLAAICVLMAEVTLVGWQLPDAPALIAILAVTALAANLLRTFLAPGREKLLRAISPLGVALSVLPLVLGVVLHLRATSQVLRPLWGYDTDWGFVVAMALVALTSRFSAFLYRKEKAAWSATYFAFSAAALMIASAGLLRMMNITQWHHQAPILMMIPIAYMAASALWRGHTPERPLAWVAQTATIFLLVPVTIDALENLAAFTIGQASNLWRGLFFAEAATFYLLTAVIRRRGANIYLAAAMAAGAIWQFLAFYQTPEPYYTVIFALLGLALLVFDRLVGQISPQAQGATPPAFQCANASLSAAFIAALLQSLARLATTRPTRRDLTALLITTAVSLLAALLVRVRSWKRWYVTTTIGLAALAFIMLNVLSELSAWQKLEIFCVIAGLALLVVGYLGRLRETSGNTNDLITLSLWLGSALATLPILIAVCYHRFTVKEVSIPNEVALLTISVLMVLSGYLMQFQATTLLGGAALVAQLTILLIFVGIQAQVALGVYLALGGAAVFGAGVALAIFRERLMTLPDQIANHEGVFKVFGWR